MYIINIDSKGRVALRGVSWFQHHAWFICSYPTHLKGAKSTKPKPRQSQIFDDKRTIPKANHTQNMNRFCRYQGTSLSATTPLLYLVYFITYESILLVFISTDKRVNLRKEYIYVTSSAKKDLIAEEIVSS